MTTMTTTKITTTVTSSARGLACCAALASVLSAGLGAGGARADESIDAISDPAALYERGEQSYKLGHFDDALAAFGKSYELSKEPALLFNIGQCHRQLKNHERAVFFFEEYLTDSADVSNRAEVEALLTEERALMDADKRAHDEEIARTAAAQAAAQKNNDAAATEDDPLKSPVVWGVGIGAAAVAVLAGTAVAVALLWPAPDPDAGSLGTVDLRGGGR
jgi:tetratricopeptide (TPR) repeat protein